MNLYQLYGKLSVIITGGILFVFMTWYTFVTESASVFEQLTTNGVLLIVPLLVSGFGLWLFKNGYSTKRILYINTWVLLGGVWLLFASFWTVFSSYNGTAMFSYIINNSHTLAHGLTFGTITGVVLGYYYDYSRRYDEISSLNTKLKHTNQQLENFTSVLSHDLRNPLTVAKGRVGLAKEKIEMEDSKKDLERAVSALERMDDMVNDMLVMAREGSKVTDRENISIEEVSTDAWKMVDTKNASLSINKDFTVSASYDRLQQIFENLFRNSVEHGGEDITVQVGACETDNGFYVEDTGPGIAEEIQDGLFEHGETTSENGTGLGLTIVKQLSEAHGWDVELDTSYTDGARFIFNCE